MRKHRIRTNRILTGILLATLLVACGASDVPAPEDAASPAEKTPKAAVDPVPTLSASTERNLLHLALWLQDKPGETGASFRASETTGPLVAHVRDHPAYGQAFEMISEMLDSAAMHRHERVFSDLDAAQTADVVAWCKGDLYPDTPGVLNQKRFSAMYKVHIAKPLGVSQTPAPVREN